MSLQEANRNTPQQDQGTSARLESWKEIAAYLQRDAKTARKWEKEEGLPIHRHTHKSRSSVYAYPAEIDRWRASRKVVAEPVARPLWKIPAFAVTMLLCLVMVGNGVRPMSAEPQQGQTRTLVCSGADCDGWISPDGKSLLTVVNGDLLLREMASNKVRRLADAAGVTLCCAPFSPDGSRVAYSRYAASGTDKPGPAELIVSGADGTTARTVHRDAIARAWSADGKRVLIGQSEAGQPPYLAWLDIGTGAIQKLATFANWYLAKVSPDGRYIAVGATKDDKSENIYILASDGSSETVVSPSAAEQRPVEWTADGKYLVFAQVGTTVDLWMARITGGKPQGSATNTHVTLQKGESLRGVDRSGAVYYRTLSSTSDIYTATMDPSTGKVTSAPVPVPANRTGGNMLPRWAPDSRRLAYYWSDPRISGPNNARELSVYSFDTGREQRVAEQAKLAGPYCWSRDGASILFNSGERNPRQPEVARFNLGTSQVTPLFPGAAPFALRSCSEDLVANLNASGIKVRNIQNGSEAEVYKFSQNPGNTTLALSHNGRNVAFVVTGPGSSVLHVVSSNGGLARDLVTANSPAELQTLYGTAWSPDDRFVYFARRPDEKSAYELFRVPAAGGTAESMGLKVEDLRDLDIAPDGTRIAFSIGAVNRPEIWAIRKFLPSR